MYNIHNIYIYITQYLYFQFRDSMRSSLGHHGYPEHVLKTLMSANREGFSLQSIMEQSPSPLDSVTSI